MEILWTIVLYFVLALCVLYLFFVWNYGYWKRKGIQGPKPTYLVGNIGETLILKKSLGEVIQDVYLETKSLPYAGIYMLLRQTWIVNDLDLIKTILVKDFIHFTDHTFKFDENVEPLSAHLFNLTGEKWKKLRNKLSPTFTSSRIKYMFETVSQCSLELNEHLRTMEGKDDLFDVKDLLAKFNTDVIGSCAFGIECNSFKNPDAEFRKMGKKLFEMGAYKSILQFLFVFMPNLMSVLKISVLGKEINDFFYNTVEKTIKYREENNIVRNDFMQLLIQLKNDGYIADEDSGKEETPVDDGTRLTTMQIAAQVFVFFIAGFETSSTTASFALYELALNPDVQQTTQQEIDQVLEKYDGKVTYEALGEMTYLTRVIEETLRKYPPLPVMFRICTKDYIIPGTDIKIEKDTPVLISALGIQRDPEFYPNPTKFDPDRFTPENRAARHHFSYLPFGEGPRICIGSRFGMMQTRLGLVSVLSKYKVSPCEKTHIPMKYDNKSFIMTSDGGLWLKLTKRMK